jgi:hypothetical protein
MADTQDKEQLRVQHPEERTEGTEDVASEEAPADTKQASEGGFMQSGAYPAFFSTASIPVPTSILL